MHKVLIAIGSNERQSVHVQWASERLSQLLDNIRLSSRLWTADVKGSGRWYMNRLAAGNTLLTVPELEQQLKQLERATGRDQERVTLDLDLMQYDNDRYHLNDWPRPYIQRLLPDMRDEMTAL